MGCQDEMPGVAHMYTLVRKGQYSTDGILHVATLGHMQGDPIGHALVRLDNPRIIEAWHPMTARPRNRTAHALFGRNEYEIS